jgi:hypothetical protein
MSNQKIKRIESKRFWCEDDSQTLKEIKSSKNNGKCILKNGIRYEQIGDDMVLNTKTNLVEKLQA